METSEFYPLKISNIRPETERAICVSFHVPKKLKKVFDYKQGQFLTLRADINGEEIRRSYSICSGLDEDCMKIGIKRVKNGRFSNYANDEFKIGDYIDVMPPQGSFFTELNHKANKRYMMIAAGSGITPILSNIKTVLSREKDSKVTLIYGNLRTNTVMFLEDLSFLKNQYLERFQWINIMDHEDQGADLLSGIIDNKKGSALNQHGLIDIKNTDEAFICGPESMMSEVARGFRSMGFDESRIHYELFTSSSDDSQKALEKYHERIEKYGEDNTSNVTVISDGRSLLFNLSTVGENILDAGIHNGLNLPYACKAGVCSTCIAKLIKGEVDMDINHALTDKQIKDGFILTCQAHPVSDEVVVDFDQKN